MVCPCLTCQPTSRGDGHQGAEACYPVDQIVNTLAKSVSRNKNVRFESALIATIQTRTVCSRPSSGELDRLRNAGGSDKLIEAIEGAAPPSPPAEAPPRPQPEVPTLTQGRLTVRCAHVECTVLVNGTPIGVTTNETLSQTMPEGPILVSAAAKDYEANPSQEIVDIRDNEPKLINFQLKATRSALEATGAKLFQQMITALGGEDGLKASEFVRGKGTITSYSGGAPTLWDVAALIQQPDKGRFYLSAFQSGRQSYEIVQIGGAMELAKIGKGVELDDLNLAIHQLREYQLSEMIRRFQSPSFKIVASDLGTLPAESAVLSAESGSEMYSIRLDSDFRPREILLESGGLDKGIKLMYSDYVHAGPAFYPKRMQVQVPSAKSKGIEVQFATVDLNPSDVRDSDFVIKKGRR